MNKKSFTLIELLVVIAIIGILSSLVIARFSDWGDNARIANTLQWSAGVHRTLGANLVGHWPLDGNANDISGYGNDGDIYGGASFVLNGVPGTGNQALNFDGENDYVDLGTNINPTNNKISVSFWLKWTGGSGDRRMPISKYGTPEGWYIEITTSNQIKFLTYGLIDSTPTSIVSNLISAQQELWYHVIGIWDKPTQYLYVNGVQESSKSANHDSISNTNILAIGQDGGYDRFYFNGLISDVRIYDTALTAEEVGQIYAETKDSYLAYE